MVVCLIIVIILKHSNPSFSLLSLPLPLYFRGYSHEIEETATFYTEDLIPSHYRLKDDSTFRLFKSFILNLMESEKSLKDIQGDVVMVQGLLKRGMKRWLFVDALCSVYLSHLSSCISSSSSSISSPPVSPRLPFPASDAWRKSNQSCSALPNIAKTPLLDPHSLSSQQPTSPTLSSSRKSRGRIRKNSPKKTRKTPGSPPGSPSVSPPFSSASSSTSVCLLTPPLVAQNSLPFIDDEEGEEKEKKEEGTTLENSNNTDNSHHNNTDDSSDNESDLTITTTNTEEGTEDSQPSCDTITTTTPPLSPRLPHQVSPEILQPDPLLRRVPPPSFYLPQASFEYLVEMSKKMISFAEKDNDYRTPFLLLTMAGSIAVEVGFFFTFIFHIFHPL